MPVASAGKVPHEPQQQHGEGEVKKIYLLQPMPRFHPPTQMKGGAFPHPQPNNFFQNPPVQQPVQSVVHKTRPLSRSNLYGDSGISQLEETVAEKSHAGKGHSELKILPIVVIPPIAPMPPIQLPQATDNNIKGKISFSPQFNNYLVTNADEQPVASGYKHQERGSFSEYGGSVGGSIYRSQSKSPRQRLRQAHAEPDPNQSVWNKLKVHPGHLEDSGLRAISEGLDRRASDYGRPVFRNQAHQPANRRTRLAASAQPPPIIAARGQVVSRRQPSGRYRNQRMPASSIRDVMDTVAFDDELESEDFREAMPSNRAEYYNSLERQPSSINTAGIPDGELDSESASDGSRSLDYHSRDSERGQRDSSMDQAQPDSPARERPKQAYEASSMDSVRSSSASRRQLADRRRPEEDLGALYYERDLSQESGAQLADRQRLLNSADRIDRRPQSDVADDNYSGTVEDEWRFDTIKSVSHASPSSNATTAGALTPAARDTNSTAPLGATNIIKI